MNTNTTAKLRKENLLAILRVIRANKLISRPEIAKRTKLTSVTVNTLISVLIERNIVLEEGFADSKGGRKAVAYRFNNKAYHIIGVNLSLNKLTIDIYDLDGNIAGKGIITTSHKNKTVEDTVSIITKGIKSIMADAGKAKEDIIGIGVLVPGRVDYKEGIIRYLPNIKNWVNIPLKEMLESELGITTIVERDTNSHILYLRLLGVTDKVSDAVYCSFSEGIGASVQIDGKVYRGNHGLAGEVGHTIVKPDGPACSCGSHGCLETLASCRAIGSYYIDELSKTGLDTKDAIAASQNMSDMEWIEILAKKADDADESADAAFSKATKYLGICIHNVINTYDPQLIVLECRWMKIARKYYNQLVSNMFDGKNSMDRNDVKVIINPVDDIFAVSTFAVVIETLMHSSSNNKLIGT